MAAKAVALHEASRPEFSTYAQAVVDNARTLADRLQANGVDVLTGGTDNHLVMVDLRRFGLTGRIAEAALRDAGLTCNRNPIPADPQGAWYTSGLRLGTPAVTTLGMGADEMGQIADVIHSVLAATRPATIASGPNAGQPSRVNYSLDNPVLVKARACVDELLGRHRLYPGIDL
jgi:glycine hydroxymethyltransferase